MRVHTVFTATPTRPASNMTSVPPKPTDITASIAPFPSLRQHFALGHPSAEAEDNELVQSAMQSAYNICHSDEAYDHPEKTRGRLLTMFSEYNQEFMDEWKKHPTDTILFALELAPEKVDTQLGIEDDTPDDLWDVDGRRYSVNFPFGIIKETLEELKEDVGCLHDRVRHWKRRDEEELYRVRDDCDECLTEVEQIGFQIKETKDRRSKMVAQLNWVFNSVRDTSSQDGAQAVGSEVSLNFVRAAVGVDVK